MDTRPLLLCALLACDRPSPAPSISSTSVTAPSATAPTVKVDVEDPKSCAPCHAAVVTEWEQSMHARAHESRDPIFAGMRQLRMKHEGEAVANKCVNCHYPRPAAEMDPAVAKRGVSCASCHQVAQIHRDRGPGGRAFVWSENGVMAGPHDIAAGASPAHGTGPALDFMKDGTSLCLACHAEAKNAQGVASCTTGAEWKADEGDSCVSCHMPAVDAPAGSVGARPGHRSHAFMGPHRAWYQKEADFLASAVTMQAVLEGEDVVVTLTNRSQHGFPSGFPGRFAAVVASVVDETGAETWTSAPNAPMEDTPDAVLLKRYVDAEGHPVPAPLAVKLDSDTRLKTGETREIRLEGVPAGAEKVQVRLLYFLLPPPLATKIGVTGVEAKPRVALTVSAER